MLVLALKCADGVEDSRPPLSAELLNPEVEEVVASATSLEVGDKVADDDDFVTRDRADDDSAPACWLVWVREDVDPDDVDAGEDADAVVDVDELKDELEDELELGVIVEVVNRDFDEEEGLDVAAMDEDENLDVDVVAATDVDVNLVEERGEERDAESLVDDGGADVARGSSVDEIVSDPAPVSSFARLVAVAAPTNQIR